MWKRRQVQRWRQLLVLEASAEAESAAAAAASRLSHRGVRRGHFLGHVTSHLFCRVPRPRQHLGQIRAQSSLKQATESWILHLDIKKWSECARQTAKGRAGVSPSRPPHHVTPSDRPQDSSAYMGRAEEESSRGANSEPANQCLLSILTHRCLQYIVVMAKIRLCWHLYLLAARERQESLLDR